MVPQMAARGYDRGYAVNVTISSALIALLIPPSHNMILYSISAGGTVSVADLFTAGIIPGLLLTIALMITAYVVARKRGYPAEPFPGFGKLLIFFFAALPGLLLIAIIFGGVRSGVFTATESSCIAVIYAFLVAVLVYRELDWSGFIEAILGAVKTTSLVLLVIGMAAAFALGAEGVLMGTRILSSAESPVHPNWKDAIVSADATDTVFLNRQGPGPALRALRTERTSRIEKEGSPNIFGEFAKTQDVYFGGDLEAGIALTGQVAGRIKAVKPVAQIFEETLEEYHRIVAGLPR